MDELYEFFAERSAAYRELVSDVQNEESDRAEQIRRARELRGG